MITEIGVKITDREIMKTKNEIMIIEIGVMIIEIKVMITEEMTTQITEEIIKTIDTITTEKKAMIIEGTTKTKITMINLTGIGNMNLGIITIIKLEDKMKGLMTTEEIVVTMMKEDSKRATIGEMTEEVMKGHMIETLRIEGIMIDNLIVEFQKKILWFKRYASLA